MTEIELHITPHDIQQVAPQIVLHNTSESESQSQSESEYEFELRKLNDLLVSEYSELTGNSQTTSNEVYHLFKINIPQDLKDQKDQTIYDNLSSFYKINITKDLADKGDKGNKLLRDYARAIYRQKLYETKATVKYENSDVIVSWKGFTATGTVKKDGRSAARNVFVRILRKLFLIWPLPDRPNSNLSPYVETLKPVLQTVPKSAQKVTPNIQPTIHPKLILNSTIADDKKKATPTKKVIMQDKIEAMDAELKALRAELDQQKKATQDAELKALRAELDQYKKATQAKLDQQKKAVQDKIDQRKKVAEAKAMQVDIKALGAQLEQYEKADKTLEAKKVITQSDFEEIHTEFKALRAELDQCKKVKAMQVELEMRKKATEAEAIQVELKALGAQLKKYEKAEKIVTQDEFEEMHTEFKVLQTELDQCKKVKAIQAKQVEQIDQVEQVDQIELEASDTQLKQYKKAKKTVLQPSSSSPLLVTPTITSTTNLNVNSNSQVVLNEIDTTNAATTLLQLMIPRVNNKRRVDSNDDDNDNDDDVDVDDDNVDVDDDDDDVDVDDNDDDDDNNQYIGSINSSPINIEQLKIAEEKGDINLNSFKRLHMLQSLFLECEREGLLVIITKDNNEIKETNVTNVTINVKETKETDNTNETKETKETKETTSTKVINEIKKCILGWSELKVLNPSKLNKKIREMVEKDEGGIWKKANGKYNQSLKKPTWGVYELLRKIGVKPKLRGPIENDPGKEDMLYYKKWEFIDDDSFKIAYKRLAKGFSYCPDKGNRERKKKKH